MIATPLTADFIRGATELETTARGIRPHRLPSWVRELFPDPQLMMVEAQPSGVRMSFTTAARRIELVTHPMRIEYRGANRPRGQLDLMIDGDPVASMPLTGGDAMVVDPLTGQSDFRPGGADTALFSNLAAGEKHVEIWLPHNESIELIELRTDEPIRPTDHARPRWLHHGSSISHGSNASTPTQIWPAVAARLGGYDLYNLGLGGSALVDPFVARVIRDVRADVISVKLGINVANFDSMRLRAFVPAVHGFLDTIREGHPDTPLLLVSPIFCGIHEDTPGPGVIDPASLATDQVRFIATGQADAYGRLTLRVIRDALASLVERRSDDRNLHYLDGLALYGESDAIEHPLPDALHPDTDTHRLIGERFAGYAFGPGGPLSIR